MRITARHSFKKHLVLTVLLFILLGLTSCTSESEHESPMEITMSEKGEQEFPNETALPEVTEPQVMLPEEMGYTIYERRTKNNVYLDDENVGNLTEAELRTKLTYLAARIDIASLDAIMNSVTWKVTKGKTGRKLNIELTVEKLLNAEEGQKVTAIVEAVSPAITSKKLTGNIVIIGSYTTKLLNRTRNRVNNIDIAAEKINYYKILPGQDFSFNKAVGRRTKEKGYEKATIFIKTKEGPKEILAYGGGICQLSSTLFNALEEGGIQILERHRHSKKVGYVPKGKDATVSYGSADFRFRNSRPYPIMIRTSLSNRYLNVKIIENRNIMQ